MNDIINTIPLQQFIQQVKAADLSQQREIKIDIKTAKNLVYCMSEINARLLSNYDELLNKVSQPSEQSISIQLDGGNF